MMRERLARAVLASAWALPVLAAMSVGCSDGEKHRASVSFHAEGVRRALDRNRRIVRLFKAGKLEEPHISIPIATDLLSRALYGLPERVEKTAETRVAERKAAAVKARDVFATLRPKLESMKFELDEVAPKLDEIEKLIDEVERE